MTNGNFFWGSQSLPSIITVVDISFVVRLDVVFIITLFEDSFVDPY